MGEETDCDGVEPRRLQRLRELLVLDTEAEPIFDSLARMASEACETPIALLSLVDAGRQWFKASVGLPDVAETPRSIAFCDHAIRGSEVLEVDDAQHDERFAANPLVTGALGVRFYAGAPLVMSTGERIGTLCVIDQQARHLSADQVRRLTDLARLTVQALELREQAIRRSMELRSARESALADSERRLRSILDAQSELVSQATPEGRLLYVNPAYASFVGSSVDSLAGANLYDHVPEADRGALRLRLAGLLSSGGTLVSENRVITADGTQRWVSWTNAVQVGPDGVPLLHSTGRDVTDLRQAQQALARSQALLEQTGRMAGVGGWEMDLRTQEVAWTSETRRIHGVPADFTPNLAAALGFYAPASRPRIEAAVTRGLTEGKPWDLELQLVTALGRPIWARAVGEVEFEDGEPVRMLGAFQDITERRLADEARAELTAIFENTTDFVLQADSDRKVRYMNPAAERALLGRPSRVGEDLYMRELLPEGTQRKFVEEILPHLQQHDVWVGQSEARRYDGTAIQVSHMVIAHRAPDFSIHRFSVILRDVSELVAAQAEQSRHTETLRSVANAIPSTVAVVDRQGAYLFVNQAFEAQVDMTSSSIIGKTAKVVLGEPEFERRWPYIARALAGERVHFEIDQVAGSGQQHLSLDYLPLSNSNGEPDGFVVVGQDITQAKLEQDRLRAMSMTDSLTRLLNRTGFNQRIQAQLSEDVPEPVALLFIDLDQFKPVNDTHGHAAGDELLRLVAKRLVRLVRPSDTAARLGGDEFALAIVGMAEVNQVTRLAQSVVDALARPFKLHSGVWVHIGASVGCACGMTSARSWPELLELSDQHLYVAKGAGRGRVSVGTAPPAESG